MKEKTEVVTKKTRQYKVEILSRLLGKGEKLYFHPPWQREGKEIRRLPLGKKGSMQWKFGAS